MSSTAASIALAATRDPGSTRIVYGIVIALVVLGVVLAAFAWWLHRTTRPDPELLAPLEAIETRRWRQLDPAGRRRLLDGLRPDGAQPVDPAPAEPPPDDEFGDEPVARDVRELAEEDSGDDEDDTDDVDVPPGPVAGEVGLAMPPSGAARTDDWQRWDAELGIDPVDDDR